MSKQVIYLESKAEPGVVYDFPLSGLTEGFILDSVDTLSIYPPQVF